jgi:hypothetical protein
MTVFSVSFSEWQLHIRTIFGKHHFDLLERGNGTPSPCCMPFSFKASHQFALLSLWSLTFSLTSFGLLHFITLTPHFWWKYHFLLYIFRNAARALTSAGCTFLFQNPTQSTHPYQCEFFSHVHDQCTACTTLSATTIKSFVQFPCSFSVM